jgi:four helix bundle protein
MVNVEIMRRSEGDREDLETAVWNEGAESLVREEAEAERVYDPEERIARFGEPVIDFAKTIPHGVVTNRLISQLIGAATSAGANYVEAYDAVSRKDFLKSIGTSRKEARATKHFFRMAVRAFPELNRKRVSCGRKLENCISSSRRFGETNKTK